MPATTPGPVDQIDHLRYDPNVDAPRTYVLAPTRAETGGFDLTGEWDREILHWRWDHRIIVAGSENDFAGYGIGEVPAWQSARKVQDGPLHAGPFAFIFPMSSWIDNSGGMAAAFEREQALGLYITVKPGDILRLGSAAYVVTLDDRRNPVLEEEIR